MITPNDKLPLDDAESEDDEQLSQQDIHSNGLDDELDDDAAIDESDALARAYEASESSYELDLGEDDDDLNED
ncbi:hypothetical protein [Mucilaginibacter sp. dw_454]|uniref:hypothetical protein n=1 Tax=Mucilaginibacter sp. dw_454 TaxID=2720079 RepID=UPI001BD4E7C7|nr:hypothetical protein [Mucilaginibacter sp. dw_454]